MTLAGAGAIYLAVGFVLWVHAWTQGASTHTLCGCGDPALFLWFFQWPATALAHGQNPFFSTALFHPGGINLLAQTSVTGLSIPLVPVTWIWGPVASLNVASTVAPALTAFTAFVVIRRWAPWTPAAFVGGLLFGFSPFVLSNLQFAHLMTAALMLLPLILAVLDEILIRQRHSSLWAGVLLGLLVFAQFFISTELLAVAVVVIVVCIVALVAATLVTDRDGVRQRAPHAARALGIGLAVAAVLLAWPMWFALAGPAHLSGLVWPNLAKLGGFLPSSFVTTADPSAKIVFLALSGYQGAPLASSTYLGWSFLAVLVAGSVAYWRDRRLWFFGFTLAVCVACSLLPRPGQWEPAQVFEKIPVIENVIEQRFMAFGFLAAAVMLAVILDHVHRVAPDWRGAVGALAVTGVALAPMAILFGARLPFTMEQVTLPAWYRDVAPTLPPDRVLLSFPTPYSGLESALSWQAVNEMHYSQAGGGGPQDQENRAGAAEAGVAVLKHLHFGVGLPEPGGTPAQYAAVRRALGVWHVTTVVIAPETAAPPTLRGRDPAFAAAFMTAALGRPPTLQAGAWVWEHVGAGLARQAAYRVQGVALDQCAGLAPGQPDHPVATLRVSDCVSLAASGDAGDLGALPPG